MITFAILLFLVVLPLFLAAVLFALWLPTAAESQPFAAWLGVPAADVIALVQENTQ